MGAASSKVVSLPRNPAALPPTELTDAELADQTGEYINQVKIFAPIARREEALKIEVRRRMEEKAADRALFIEGEHWRVEASAREMVTSLPPLTTIHKLYRAAKKDFYAACKIALKQIAADLGEAMLDHFARKEQTGIRRITAVFTKATAA